MAADKTFNKKRSIKVEKGVQSPQRSTKLTGLTSPIAVQKAVDI